MTAARGRLWLALVAAVFLLLQSMTLGTVSENHGLGWDGEDYARMLTGSLDQGTPNTRLRPLIVLLNRPVQAVTDDAVRTFRIMNLLYAAALGWALAALADAYGASRSATAYLVATLGLSIATSGMFAYYPVLIDLGAYAVFTLTLLALVRGRWVTGAILLVLAALSREFVVALLAFTLVRVVRTVRPWPRAARVLAGTLTPAVVTTLALRAWSTQAGGAPLSVGTLLANLGLWADPWFASLFLYFLVSLFGGVSAIILVNWRPVLALWRTEWEWLVYAGTVVAFSVVGDADIWRYLAYLVPAGAVLFGRAVDGLGGRWRLAVLSLGGAVTLATQQPFRAMSVARYFSDWFPYYVLSGRVRAAQEMSGIWGWRLSGLLAAVIVLAVLSHLGARARRDQAA